MITVGYGDILPVNDLEMSICIFAMLISCGMFAYSVNTVGVVKHKILIIYYNYK